MIRLKGRANEGDGIPNLRALNRRIFFHSEYGVRNLGKRRPPALPSPRGEGGIRRSHARRMTDEVSCREGRGMLPQTAQGLNSSGFPTAAEIAGFLPLPPAAGGCNSTGRGAFFLFGKTKRKNGGAHCHDQTCAGGEILRRASLAQDDKGPRNSQQVGNRTPCGARKTLRAYADPPVFRPLRKLRVGPRNLYGAGTERLAVPEKPFGLTLILRFFDRCGNCGPPLSAAGGGGPQFLIILNSGGGDCFLLVTCGIVCPSKDETEKRREDAC